MDTVLKDAIIAVYERWQLPADHIVCDPLLSQGFTNEVIQETGGDQAIRIVDVNRGLLRLRKAGHLPRVGPVTAISAESAE